METTAAAAANNFAIFNSSKLTCVSQMLMLTCCWITRFKICRVISSCQTEHELSSSVSSVGPVGPVGPVDNVEHDESQGEDEQKGRVNAGDSLAAIK
jgi:hypothetical protein